MWGEARGHSTITHMRDELREVEEPREEALNREAAGQGRYVVPFTMSREEEAIGMELARSHLTQLMVECAAESMDEPWTRVKSRKSTGVTLWEKRSKREHKKKKWASIPGHFSEMGLEEDSEPMIYSVRSSTTVFAPLDTVLKILDASVATAHRSFTRLIYGNLVADTSVLFHSSTPATDFMTKNENDNVETLAVRWLVCRCSSPMVSDCDFCLQEYTKRFSIDELAMNGDHYSNNKENDMSGAIREGLHPIDEMPVAYKLFRSMETRHCPELLESHRVVRCKVPLGGFLLYPTNSSDKTDVVFYMSIAQDAGGDRSYRSGNPALNNPMLTQCSDRQFRALQSVVRQMAQQIGRFDNAVESYKLSMHLESLRTLQWVCNAERTECVVCCRRFHQLTRRRHHCRLCGEVICRECSVIKDVDLPTFGPTALRICTSCNLIHSTPHSKAHSESAVAVPQEKARIRRIPVTTDHATEKLTEQVTVTPTLEGPLRRRSRTLGNDSAKNIFEERQARELAERRFDAHRQNKLEQAASCPKPVASPVIDRRYFPNKLSGTRMLSTMKPPVGTTAPSTPKTTPYAIGMHRSSSETFSPPGRPRHTNPSQFNDNDDEDKFASYVSQAYPDVSSLGSQESQWNSPSSRPQPTYAAKSGILANGNQQSIASVSPLNLIPQNQQQDRPLIYRSFETLKSYEDIFLKLCENSASVRSSKFVALTIYTRTTSADKNQQNEVEADEKTIHYLKVKGSTKLIKTAANMRCCDPVLQLNKPVITRNTWALDSKSLVHPSGFAFRQLPIVMGPQQARFYAGVPLTDSKKRYRYGALAIFDTTISPGEDDDLPMKKTLQALEVCAREAVMAIDERRKELELRTFLEAPLIQLRQSEPALNVSMETSQSSARWRDIESLDGDSDDDEDQRRLEYGYRDVQTKSDPELDSGNSSVGKARVEYFRNKMQELVRQAQDTQAQMVENTLVMERHGVPIV